MKNNNPIKSNIILFLILFIAISSNAQEVKIDTVENNAAFETVVVSKDTIVVQPKPKGKKDAVRIGYEVIDGDTIPVYLYNDVHLQSLKTEEEIKRYKKLVRDVKVALPYAKLAAFRLQMMEDNLRMIKSEKAKKKYIKQCEKAIKEEFMNDLKNLTITQGKLLLKLIHRETGKSTWEILNAYQGKLGPIFWNTMAAMYGATTKVEYDVVLDREVEEIIKKLELE
jgi:hypothetical protein